MTDPKQLQLDIVRGVVKNNCHAVDTRQLESVFNDITIDEFCSSFSLSWCRETFHSSRGPITLLIFYPQPPDEEL